MRAIRIPLPPPPATALISTGYPSRFATASASSGVFTTPSLPGVTGTPARFMISRARDLSPMSRMFSGDGPMNVIPQSSQISAKCAFSDKNPKPGWIASTSVTSAALMMLDIFR